MLAVTMDVLEKVRNGQAQGIRRLWQSGILTAQEAMAELQALLAQGPCARAEETLQLMAAAEKDGAAN